MTTWHRQVLHSGTTQIVAVFLLGLLMAAGGALWRHHEIDRDAANQFRHSVERVSAEVARRFRQPTYGLNGARGVYAVSKTVRRADFLAYVESRNLAREFPGVRGFGFIQHVMRSELDAFLVAERADGAPAFALRQLADKNHDDLYVIKFIEPAANNLGAMGLDVGSEANRRDAAQQAVDTGEPALTGAITLVQDNGKTPGALLYVPVYARGGHTSTVEQRRASLVGLLYAPIVIAELLDGMVEVGQGRVDFELFDSAQNAAGDTAIYDSDHHLANLPAGQKAIAGRRFATTQALALPGLDMVLRVSSTAGFDAGIDRSSPWLAFVFGAMLSALLALLMRQQATARHRAEALAQRMTEQLRRDEARSRDFSRSASDWFWETDAEHRFCYFSDNFEKDYGLALDQLLGKSRNELLNRGALNPPEMREAYLAQLDAHLPFKNFEYQLRVDSGEIRWLSVSGRPYFDAQGHFAGYRGTGTVISERKEIEQQLAQQKEHLEELVAQRTGELSRALEAARQADVAKDAFLANMSHELRTPLSAVIGMAGLALNLSTEPKQRDYLDKIVRSGKHLNRIINELLDLSKIAAGKMEIEAVAFRSHELIRHATAMMEYRASEKGLELVATIDAAVPDVLRGDPVRIEQILLNLLGNAIKFTLVGRIAVRVRLHAHEDIGICLDIEVADTGVGMRAEDLEHLFKPFAQADATVSRKFGGTGLGLTVSRRLAELMGGDISVTSREGIGTTFTARIWLEPGDAADLPATDLAGDAALPAHYDGVRILVADDQPLNREIVEALLAAVGIVPRMAADGQEALDILTQVGPDVFDLVLMDVQMPVMDGIAATRALRRMAGFESLPIIAMTAHTLAHEQKLNAAAGMNDHIGKPFDNLGFYRTLAKWIPESKQKTSPAAEELPGQSAFRVEAPTDLNTLRDVDVVAALARFGGNEGRYRHWLAEFAATAAAVPDQMRSEIAAGQADEAAKTAHAFKGRVGMLGMTQLYGVVAELEPALRDGTPVDELLSRVAESIAQMRGELARVFGSDASGAKASAPTNAANEPQLPERVVWSDAYSVGVAEMDKQHRKLAEMINQLADGHAARGDGSAEAFHKVLSGMFDYTQVHFKAEEAYLHRIGYPRLTAHEKEHAAFVEKMVTFSAAAADNLPDMAGVHHYLKEWLLSHILQSDMQYRRFVEEAPAETRQRHGPSETHFAGRR